MLPDRIPERMQGWPMIFVTNGGTPKYEFRNVQEPVLKCLQGVLGDVVS
jgi:hypothetical protein